MAKELGIKQHTYSKIENGLIDIKANRLEKIATILNVPIEIILNKDFPLLNIDIKSEKVDKRLDCNIQLREKIERIITILNNEIQHLKK